MRLQLFAVTLTLGLGLAGVAAAQTTGGGGATGLTYQQQTGGAVGRMTAAQETWRFETEEQRRARLGTPEELEEEYGAERMDLARRVADLVEQGRCREAREMASAAGERQMVIRIRQTCRSRG